MNDNEQHDLGLDNPNQEVKKDGPVECLGKTFANDAERRKYYLSILAEKLKDPEFRKIEGFPIGEDEAILELSDPPYYTACPNPFIEDFIRQHGSRYEQSDGYEVEPLAVDTSIGKNDPIYKAHSYHTKVPHLAIVPSILHFTKPNDLVLDAFGGSGMTAVAAQWCGGAPDSYKRDLEKDWASKGLGAPEWGFRKAILNDLSPSATFISSNYNIPFSIGKVLSEADRILAELEEELGWMYFSKVDDSDGCIDFTVWSDVFNCPDCAEEIIFHDHALDKTSKKVMSEVVCPSCDSVIGKKDLDLAFESIRSSSTGEITEKPRRVPVLVRLSVGKKKIFKRIDSDDLKILSDISMLDYPVNAPVVDFPDMQMMRVGRMKTTKVRSVEDLFLSRSMHVLARYFEKVNELKDQGVKRTLRVIAQHQFVNASIMNRYRPASSFGNSPMTGVFYVSSLIAEANVLSLIRGSVKRIKRMEKSPWGTLHGNGDNVAISTGSAAQLLQVADNTIDYIFTDPPFGENIYYSDLNYIVEAWYGVLSNSKPEAIIDRVKGKGVNEYQGLMTNCFSEYYRVLKPGRWMTVVFSNSKTAVWNAIQEALQQAGFIVAEVSTLDKVHLSFQQVMSPNAVKQDLVISLYKPNKGFEDRFKRGSDEDGVWDLIRTHLGYLAVVKKEHEVLVKVRERDPRVLFDRMVAFFVRNSRNIPVSSREFLDGLSERFTERDGMIFLPEQVAEYDKARISSSELKQLSIFVDDEASAIEWLRQLLNEKPQGYQDIHPKFINELSGWKKSEEQLELFKLLEQNFLKYDDQGQLPPQIHSYLSTNFKEMRNLAKNDPQLLKKAKDRWYVANPDREEDLQKWRDKELLKQFEEYKSHIGRKLKTVRLEALRCGFKKSWQDRDYKTIIEVAEKIPQNLLQEDQKLLMWFDQAQTRSNDESLF